MKKSRGLWIVKRDGSHEAFDFAKLRRCVGAAMRACRYDDACADALCRAVRMHLDEARRRPPSSEYVFRCVQSVLNETGLADVAEQLAGHRKVRDGRRRALAVIGARNGGAEAAPWEKSRVARSLERRYQLTHSTARILAGEIEQRVLALEYRVVSAALVDELVRNELMSWGLATVPPPERRAPEPPGAEAAQHIPRSG